jgi:hypothetical protein
MPEPVSLLLREFLAWVSARRRTYAEAMEAWRSSCPRHTVWEDALGGGLIQIESGETPQQPEVTLTPRGRALLDGKHDGEAAAVGVTGAGRGAASGPTA